MRERETDNLFEEMKAKNFNLKKNRHPVLGNIEPSIKLTHSKSTPRNIYLKWKI